MISSLQNLRYEKKFVAEGAKLPEVLAQVRRHPAAFREVYSPRVVNNVYLDSPTRSDYHDHINGAANRTKTRVRWYGPQFESAERPFLERKLKRGLVSGKEAYALPQFAVNGSCVRSLLETHFDTASLPSLLHSALKLMEPALFNRYQRHYFLSRDGKFRLTVDSRLQFAVVNTGRFSTHSWTAVPTVVIELKFGSEFVENAASITHALPYRLARFSKYVVGMEASR
jgi:hypothetical protein